MQVFTLFVKLLATNLAGLVRDLVWIKVDFTGHTGHIGSTGQYLEADLEGNQGRGQLGKDVDVSFHYSCVSPARVSEPE